MSKAGKFCLVYYYVPEDKDDPEFPNGFGLNLGVEEVKISDIRKMFPLEGEYIFRFKVKIGNSTVWMDVKEDAKIPLFNGKIIVKATRISWERKGTRNRGASEGVREEARSTTPTANTNSASYQEKSYTSGPSISQSNGPNQSQSGTFGAEDLNLLGTTYVSNSKSSGPVKNQNVHEDHDLLNFSHPPSSENGYKVNQNQESKKNDLLSFDNLF